MRQPPRHRSPRFNPRGRRFQRGDNGRPLQRGEFRGTPAKTPAEESFLSKTSIDPRYRLQLEKGSSDLTMRAMDLLCPIGKGQRGLIVSPPKAGKTTFLKQICLSLAKSEPSLKLYCLLVDERPEEVTD